MDGILVINKEVGYTSRDVVNIVSSCLHTKKIGHTGTLDPLATGVLVLCIGKATKLVEVLTNKEKEYEAEITLGLMTDTLDITGNIIKEEIVNLNDEEIINAIYSMKGSYNQQVPIYSAVKINGKKLYEYARQNEKIDLPSRKVEIKEIELISPIKRDNSSIIFSIKTKVSKGTYIRSLVNDIASKLNTIGVMSKLNRISQGNFKIKDSFKIEDIKNGNYKIESIENSLKDYFTVIVTDDLEKKIINGAKIPNKYNHDIVSFKNVEKLIALYKIDDTDSNVLRVWKMF